MRGIHQVDEEASASNLIGDVRLAALAAALLATFGAASAQQPPPAESSGRAGLSERVMRDAESPMRWIKMHSETLRRSEESRKAAAAASAAAPPVAAATPVVATAAPAGRSLAAKTVPAKPQRPAGAAPNEAASTPAANATAVTATAARPDGAAEERPLVTIDRAEPEWDDDLIRNLRKGRVVVRFIVAEDGYLSRIQIVESTHSRLTGPAMAAVMQWRFEPIAEPRVATVEFGFDSASATR